METRLKKEGRSFSISTGMHYIIQKWHQQKSMPWEIKKK